MDKTKLFLKLLVGLCVTAGFISTLFIYIQTKSVLGMISFITCFVGSAIYWITFIIEVIQAHKKGK